MLQILDRSARSFTVCGMTPLLSDTFREHYMNRYGISEADIAAALRQPESLDTVPVPGGEPLSLIASQVAERKSVLLLQGRLSQGVITVDFALWIPKDIAAAAGRKTPLLLLKELVDRFGYDFSIGERRGRLIIGEKIPVSSPNPGEFVRVHDATTVAVASMIMRLVKENDQLYADCALCFFLNTEAYAAAIGA
jgi:hypothetical protein